MAGKNHTVPLWGLFLALLALTAGEVGLYEVWRETQFVPKFVIVLIILVLTLPKAAIVMIYFMHLKFEKPLIVALAVGPLVFVLLAVLPTLTDIRTLKPRLHNQVSQITGHGVERKVAAGAAAGQAPKPKAGEAYE